MLEPTMRELMENAGIENITIRTDNRGLLGSGEFRGTKRQLRNRLGQHFELDVLESANDLTTVRCRPLE